MKKRFLRKMVLALAVVGMGFGVVSVNADNGNSALRPTRQAAIVASHRQPHSGEMILCTKCNAPFLPEGAQVNGIPATYAVNQNGILIGLCKACSKITKN